MRVRAASDASSVTLAASEGALEKVFATPELVRLIGRAVFDAVKVQHPDWIPERSGVPPASCEGGFAPARFACVSKTCREQMAALWRGPTFPSRDWATRLILEFVKEEMLLTAMNEWPQSDDEADSEDDGDGPWLGSDPALVIGARGEYQELREALCVGRRFYRNKDNAEHLNSTRLDEPLPASAHVGDDWFAPYDAARTGARFHAQLHSMDGMKFKYTMPARVEELDRILEARGSPFGGCLALTGTGGMSDAGEELILGLKVGDLPRKFFFFNMEEEIYEACGGDDEEEVSVMVHDVMLDVADPTKSFVQAPLLAYAPPYFVDALTASARAAFDELFEAAGPAAADDVPAFKDALGDLGYVVCGGAGGQNHLQYLIRENKKKKAAEKKKKKKDPNRCLPPRPAIPPHRRNSSLSGPSARALPTSSSAWRCGTSSRRTATASPTSLGRSATPGASSPRRTRRRT